MSIQSNRKSEREMKSILKGTKAVAETVSLCKPSVIATYPITPSTEIVETLARFVADGKLNAKYINVEAEFSAISALAGASATGVRTFTATASQGLALMHEVLFATAGMRLPIVIVVANRALSAPINIWNDHQDSISERDSGWIQLWVESVQEAVDTLIQAYKVAENKKVLLPVMVNMDGYYLTHVSEPVDIPSENDVESFLPNYEPKHAYLDPEKPMTQGPFSYPEFYMALRKQIFEAVKNSSSVIKEVHDDFAKKFNRAYGNGLVEEYKNNRKVAIVALGSICSTIKTIVDKRNDIGLLRVRCFRPFPRKDVINALKDKELVIVIDRDISLGNSGALFSEVRDALYSVGKPTVVNFIAGLGGVDITTKNIDEMIEEAKKMKDGEVKWLM